MDSEEGREPAGDLEEPFDPGPVPPGLRDLIPLAQRWGLSCAIERGEALESATPEELAEIADRLRGRHDAIEDWLYSFPMEPPATPPDAAAAFQALLVAEMEYCGGPGVKGHLEWAFRVHTTDPSPAARHRLQHAYDEAVAQRSLKYRDPAVIQAIEVALSAQA